MGTEYLDGVCARLDESIERARSLAGGLNREQLNWRADTKSWSIGQCLEHTRIAADDYSEPLGTAIDAAQTGRAGAKPGRPRHTFTGWVLIQFIEPKARLRIPAPRGFVPASEVDVDIVERFVATHARIVSLARACAGLDLNRVRMCSPESRLIRLNAVDAFMVLAMHAERHLSQAERVRAMGAWPAEAIRSGGGG